MIEERTTEKRVNRNRGERQIFTFGLCKIQMQMDQHPLNDKLRKLSNILITHLLKN